MGFMYPINLCIAQTHPFDTPSFRPHKFCKSHLGEGFLGCIVILVFSLVLIKFYFKQKIKREILNNFSLTNPYFIGKIY